VTFVHRTGFLGTVSQPVTYQIANDWTGLSGIGITTNILIPTIIPPAPPAPAPAPAPPAPATEPVAVLEDPHAVVDVSDGAWDTNQIISIFTNDVFPGSEASMVSIKLCATLDGQMATGPVSQGCTETTLTVPGEGTYTVNSDGTVTFDPLPSFHGTATPIRYQAVDKLGRFVNSTITSTVEAPPVLITVSNELPATGENLLAEFTAFLLLAVCGFGLRRRFKNA
jgi:CshA-type fibril repeat protein